MDALVKGNCRRWLAACLATLSLANSQAASPDLLAAPRAEFQRAYARIADTPNTATADSTGLRSYVLYPYLQAARLGQAVSTAGTGASAALDEEVAAFLRAHEGELVALELRRNWLTSLAARASWNSFLAFHREASDGPALRCQGFTARIELKRTEDLAANIAQAWLTPRSIQECERAFEWLRAAGGLTDTLIEQRARLALEGGNAAFGRQIAQQLPNERAQPLLQWAALLQNPQREIDALLATPATTVDPRALLAAWAQLARSNHAAAEQRFEKLLSTRNFDRRAASPFALAVALPLSWDRDPDTLKFFARVDAADFDDYAREWQTRAALWARDWKQVSRSIAAMTDESRRTARWRYWAARAAAHDGIASARSMYESILAEDNYYSAMAAARLDRGIVPNPKSVSQDAAQLASIEDLPAFVRARELRLSGLLANAQAEWAFGLGTLQPSARAQAILLAAGWGWYDQAVATATGERVFNDYALLYPRPYDSEVAAAARVSGLPSQTIYGVIRQESLYRSDAVSTADARGLMQLLPETARRTARDWKLPAPSTATLFDPAVNVMLGAAHLEDLVNRFGGQLPLALASYNAGPGAVQRWMPANAVDPDIWIENIPYNETRTYVQRILWHTVVFAWLRDPQPQTTQAWLKDVRPVGTAGR